MEEILFPGFKLHPLQLYFRQPAHLIFITFILSPLAYHKFLAFLTGFLYYLSYNSIFEKDMGKD